MVTYKDSILVHPPSKASYLATTKISIGNSEEADEKLVRHALQCTDDVENYKQIVVRTGDTDVIVVFSAFILSVVDFSQKDNQQFFSKHGIFK